MKIVVQTKLLLMGLLLLNVCGTAMAQSPVVGVYGIHYGGKVQYHYRVTNSGAYPISAVWVGHDTQNDIDPYNSIFELKEYPSGMVDPNIPAASVTAPLGWASMFIGQEETLEHSIKWRMEGVNRAPINAGQTLSGMSVTLDKMDSTYMTSHVTLYCWSPITKEREITVPLQSLDVIPPTLTVTLAPNWVIATNQLYPITATIAVTDNYDPQPEIKLESITVSEVSGAGDIVGAAIGTDDRQFQLMGSIAGSASGLVGGGNWATPQSAANRVYTVTYSAMDGSGNKALTSATVTVQPNYVYTALPVPSAPVSRVPTPGRPVLPATTPWYRFW